jgi:uncharacterized membrane protein
LALFCFSFYLAWQISATSNFLYPIWYEVLDLDEVISMYAPNNNFKRGFENTNQQAHIELFAGIVNGIQHGGKGLRELQYKDSKTSQVQTLLTDAEVVHLQDVANLVSKFKNFGITCLIISLFLLTWMLFKNYEIAKFRYHLTGGVSIIFFLTILIFTIGPTKIFYLGHELIFPNNHQWFFYYEDSLMSTMMKAPVLFGPVACQLVLLTMLFWVFMLYVFQKCSYVVKKA